MRHPRQHIQEVDIPRFCSVFRHIPRYFSDAVEFRDEEMPFHSSASALNFSVALASALSTAISGTNDMHVQERERG
jgi:hypothetical protein